MPRPWALLATQPLLGLGFGVCGLLAWVLPLVAGSLTSDMLCGLAPYGWEWPTGVAGHTLAVLLFSWPLTFGLLACAMDSAREGRLTCRGVRRLGERWSVAVVGGMAVILPVSALVAVLPPAVVLALPVGYALWLVSAAGLPGQSDGRPPLEVAADRLKEQAGELTGAYLAAVGLLALGAIALGLAVCLVPWMGQRLGPWMPGHAPAASLQLLSVCLGASAFIGLSAAALLTTALGLLTLGVGHEQAAARAGLRAGAAWRADALPPSPLLRQARKTTGPEAQPPRTV